eukprot:9491934-Heterocapsa_arctica.AAC.1
MSELNYAGRHEELDMEKLLATTFDVNPLGVTVFGPMNPIPPAAPETEDKEKTPDDASIAELQSGVRDNEPPVPKKRWGKNKGAWADLTDSMDEGGDAEEVPDNSADINVESDDVEYAR